MQVTVEKGEAGPVRMKTSSEEYLTVTKTKNSSLTGLEDRDHGYRWYRSGNGDSEAAPGGTDCANLGAVAEHAVNDAGVRDGGAVNGEIEEGGDIGDPGHGNRTSWTMAKRREAKKTEPEKWMINCSLWGDLFWWVYVSPFVIE